LHTVLILGGYGNFGTIISRALVRDEGLRLLIAGRNGAKARRFALELGLAEQQGIALDADVTSLTKQLAALQVDTVIHAAGPFQNQDYRVAQACIAAGCHYLDLADGRDFVANIGKLDAAAREAGVLVVSGASSVPALSSAVVDYFLPQFSRLDMIRHGIVSGAKTPGVATVRAVLGYCGKPFTRLEGGYWKGVLGWQGLHRRRYPEPIGRRWLGNCDVPDLALFPQRYPGVRNVTFHAGLGVPLTHLALWACSWLVRWQLVSNMTQFARPLHWLSRRLEIFGPQVSAMHVELSGLGRDGQPLTRTWHIIARKHHGPYIPCGAAIVLVRKLANGSLSERGAMPCVGLLTLDEYMSALAGLDIRQIHG
jgi:saccharopine dehydrogenase-like NADP-dependent oxidoreductase